MYFNRQNTGFFSLAGWLLLLPFLLPLRSEPAALTPPLVVKTGQTANSFSYSWSPVEGADQYALWYVRLGDQCSSQTIYTSQCAVSWTQLPPGTYQFHFVALGGGSRSDGVIIEELVMF